MSRKFYHDGKTFEIREAILNSRYCVRVYLDDKQVSPEYSATLEVGQDFFLQHQQRIVDELAKIAESDVRNEIYFQA
ncbi:MAG: hypothetical protein V2I38_13950 [Alcanivoracaceae bacterium]|jgi:hypothetical protein|nr:hypothetical protein [Alcanivoracaceae bacterium]